MKYLWPFDKLCYNCCNSIRIEKPQDIQKVIIDSKAKYFCVCPHCSEKEEILEIEIPEGILKSL